MIIVQISIRLFIYNHKKTHKTQKVQGQEKEDERIFLQ